MKLEWTDHVCRAQAGDERSLETVIVEVKRRLLVYIYRLTLDHHLADDLVQDVLVEMLGSLDCLRRADRFWSWAFRIALNKVRDHRRRCRVRDVSEAVPLAAVRELPGWAYRASPAEEAADRELQTVVFGEIEDLDRSHRHVITRRVYQEAPYAQIAAETGRTEGHVQVTFLRAKRSLQTRLERRGVTCCG